MAEVHVLTEHRRGAIRDITFETLAKGRQIANSGGLVLSAILLGTNCGGIAEELAPHTDRVLFIDHPDLSDFNAESYQKALTWITRERKPRLLVIGHTSFGIDLAPALAVELGFPLATDCIDAILDGDNLVVTRQIYGGKLNVEASIKEAPGHILTLRPATFEPSEPGERGEIVALEYPGELSSEEKTFTEYIEPPADEVDIADAEILISVGRGIKDGKNLPVVLELAEALKGEVGCSRPIVDKGWLPKERQVGSSGKTVKPKLYIASGISGSFQHVMGMKGADLIVAINKDPKAPIFRIADYGIVNDLFKVLPALTQRVKELKTGK